MPSAVCDVVLRYSGSWRQLAIEDQALDVERGQFTVTRFTEVCIRRGSCYRHICIQGFDKMEILCDRSRR